MPPMKLPASNLFPVFVTGAPFLLFKFFITGFSVLFFAESVGKSEFMGLFCVTFPGFIESVEIFLVLVELEEAGLVDDSVVVGLNVVWVEGLGGELGTSGFTVG